jgi:hypothetical protein
MDKTECFRHVEDIKIYIEYLLNTYIQFYELQNPPNHLIMI